MHSLAGVLCALLCVCVFSQTPTHVYITFDNVPGADGVATGPLSVPTGFGSLDGQAEVTYDAWALVYNQGYHYAVGHATQNYYNNTITVTAIQGYTVKMLGMEYSSFLGFSDHPTTWYVSCGSGAGNTKKNVPISGSWPNSAYPVNTTSLPPCSGNQVAMVWGDSYALVVYQIHYSVTGNNACNVNNGGCGAGVCSYGGPGIPNCACNPGYENDFGTCVAINNCATNNGGCDPLPAGACFYDGPGQSHCDCADGYEEVGGSCVDVDECVEYPNNAGCGTHGICTNTPGSYFCTCNTGYSGDGTFCTANANCLSDCGPNAYCAFSGGIYTCQCVSSGYVGSPPSVPCTDVNECASNVCGVGACVNEPGTYICYCPTSGYSGNGTGAGPCLDIDECGATPTICGSLLTGTCTNLEGTFECACNQGYQPVGIIVGKRPSPDCSDINECATSNWCPNATCTNLPGSYHCTACPSGYYRNSTTRECLDVDECAAGLCVNGTGACQNIPGTFICCGVVGYASQDACLHGQAATQGGGTVTAKQGAIYFSYALAALIVCVAAAIMFLLCRKRHKRRKHIERLRGHANMEEELEMPVRGTAGDMLNQPLEGDLLDEPKETNDEDPAGPFGRGKRESSQDLMGATNVARGSGKHMHSSSSSASELANAGGTKEGDVYVGAAPAENVEVADEDRPADGDYVMVVSPVHGAHNIQNSPNVRVLANDQRSQEFKAAKINAVAVANAASVLAVSALGGSPRNHPSQPLPSVQQQQQQRLAPQVMLRAPMNVEPAVPASPGKRALPVVPDAEEEAETREPEGPRGGGLEVPDDPYGGENSQNSAHSVNRSQNAMHMANIGEPQIDAEDDQHDGIANPAAAQPFDYDEDDDGEPTAALNPADKKKSDKKRRQEEEKRRKAEKAAEEKRKKEAKAEEEKAKKERKNAEKAEAERLKREKNNMDAAQRTQQEKESAIRAAFAKLRGQVPALEQEQQQQAVADDEVLRQPQEEEAEAAAEEQEPAETNNNEGGNSRDVTPKAAEASPKEGGHHHAQEGRPSENNNSPSGSRHAAPAPAVAPVSVGSASFGHNPLNVHASASQGHAKKNSGANDYMSPSAMMMSRGSNSQGSGAMASAMASASPSDEARNVPPNLLRMTSEGLPRQRHSSSSAAAHTVTLRDVLTGRNRACLQAYSDWCHAENAEGPLKFYVAVEEYRHQKAELEQKYLNEEPLQIAEDLAEKANDIFKQHLNPNAKGFLNLPEDVATRLAQRSWKYHKKGEMEAVLLPSADGVGFAVAAFVPTVFDESQEVVFKMMEADSWFRFMKTDRAKEFGS